MTDRPVLAIGSWGPDVKTVQICLEVMPLDGDFGNITHTAVQKFQRENELSADGIVGNDTWYQLEELYDLPPYPPYLLPPLPERLQAQIYAICDSSDVTGYSWQNRGMSPAGYVKGMAVGFSTVLRKHVLHYSAALDMARASTGNKDKDVLAWYEQEFAKYDMAVNRDGIDTLRHLWVLLYGLGMRESSGKYCCGRDMSASNVSADTAEAGLFQMSWNAHNCSPEIERLFDEYSQEGAFQQGAKEIFDEDVVCTNSDLSCYGSGQGVNYQRLAKVAPQFAAEACAIGLRYLRQHWGPINRKEVEVRPEVDDMFIEIQELIAPTLV